AEYFIDVIGANGSGFVMAATDGAFNSKNEDVTATLSAATFNALGQGTHAVWVHGKDANGVWGTTVQVSANLLKDTIAPAVSVPDPIAADDTGISNTDNVTSKTKPTFTGTSEFGST